MVREKHYKVHFTFNPYPKQREILDYLDGNIKNPEGNAYRFMVAIFGRQSGKSWLARYAIMDRAINQGQNCMWVSPTISSARTHWNRLVALITKSNIPVKKLSQSAKEIHFYGGGTISIRSAIEPDNLRGDSLDFLVMDEAAFFRNGEYVWLQVLMPQITATGGSVLVTTTPNGRNWVYDLFKFGQDANNVYYKSWQVPSTSSPYQDLRLLEEIRKTMPTKVWEEEYLAKFLADGGGVFSGVEEAAIAKFMPTPIVGHEYLLSVDFGWSNNPTAITVIDKWERRQVWGERFVNIGTIRTVKKIIEALDHWQPSASYMETNGLGKPLFNLIREVLSGRGEDDSVLEVINQRLEDDPDEAPIAELIGGHKVRGVNTGNENKRRIVERLAADIEYGRFFILDDQSEYGEKQMSEMSTFERKVTATGMPTYAAVEGSTDDTVMALAICYDYVPKPKKIKPPEQEQTITKRKSPFRSNSLKTRKHRR